MVREAEGASESAAEATAADVPDGAAVPASAPATDDAAKAGELLRANIEAKLAEARDRRAAANHGKRARAERQAAEAARKEAEAERAVLAEGRKDYKKFFEANGMDPRAAYEDMTRQAIESNTPEAAIKRMQEDFRKEIAALRESEVEPLKKSLAQLEEEKQALASRAYDGQLVHAFSSEVQDPSYASLRTEYDDADLLEYVRHFDKNPRVLIAEAKRFGVRLTNSDGRFTMREALNVLKSAQDAHDQGRQQRAAKLAPAAPSAKSPTVNGTAPRGGNVGTTIGNDVASERASPSRRLSRRERIEAEIERQEKR